MYLYINSNLVEIKQYTPTSDEMQLYIPIIFVHKCYSY